MKKICITVVISAMLLGVPGYAAGSSVSIIENKVENGLVTVTVKNNSETDTELGMTAVKEDENASFKNKVYAALQQNAKAGETTTFKFFIPENKDGISAAGKYSIKVYGVDGDIVENSFEYADARAVADFITRIKDEVLKVTEAKKAYELLGNVINDSVRVVILNLGVDYDAFKEEPVSVRNDALNLLYAGGIDSFEKENFSGAFKRAYGVALYNSERKTDGMTMLDLTYNKQAVNSGWFSAVGKIMDDGYESFSDFEADFKVAYGIETINRATVNSVEGVLGIFAEETKLSTDIIKKIKDLSPVNKKYMAYEHIISSISLEKIQSQLQLENLLKAAYDEATKKTTQTGSGGGGGGGASGSSANKVESNKGLVAATGSETTSEKPAVTPVFSDLPTDHWAMESVKRLKNLGIISGNENGEFEPNRAVTREEFTKMLVLACDIEIDGKDTDFADAEYNAWYRPYIGIAAELGIVNGTGENLFGIGKTITRQDMAVMVARAMKIKGIEIPSRREYVSFADNLNIADYAADEIEMLYKAEIVNGKGDGFDPEGSASRAEAAKIIYEAFKGGK